MFDWDAEDKVGWSDWASWDLLWRTNTLEERGGRRGRHLVKASDTEEVLEDDDEE